MSDHQNLRRPAPEVVEDGIPAIDEMPEDVLLTGDPLDDTLSPEESAMRIVDEPPGMNYDPDPGYIDRD